MSQTMIERVAIALSEADTATTSYQELARVAVEAMRVPTKEMVLAGLNCDAWADHIANAVEMMSGMFTAAIDAALKEPTK